MKIASMSSFQNKNAHEGPYQQSAKQKLDLCINESELEVNAKDLKVLCNVKTQNMIILPQR